jgi:hypothetical protein
MFSLLKFLMFLAMVGVVIWFGTSVKLGDHTLFGHAKRIWNTAETQDLVNGAKEKAGPAVEKVKRGVKAGIDEAEKDDAPDAGPRVIVKKVEDANAIGAARPADAEPAARAPKPNKPKHAPPAKKKPETAAP